MLLLVLNQFALNGLIDTFFTVPGKIGSEMAFTVSNPLDYVRLFTHVLGHGDWNHLLGNLSFILLLGPLLEERYGSPMLVLMISTTALVTGVVNVCFFARPMVRASGIAFMMILLSSFTAISKHQIPLTFLLLFVPVAHADPGVVLIFLKKPELDRSTVFSNGIGSCLSYP